MCSRMLVQYSDLPQGEMRTSAQKPHWHRKYAGEGPWVPLVLGREPASPEWMCQVDQRSCGLVPAGRPLYRLTGNRADGAWLSALLAVQFPIPGSCRIRVSCHVCARCQGVARLAQLLPAGAVLGAPYGCSGYGLGVCCWAAVILSCALCCSHRPSFASGCYH